VDQQAQTIREAAQTAARPHYDAAYAAPGASDEALTAMTQNQSNAMRGALGHARELALRENRDPTALGFDLDPLTNEVTLNRVPSFETLDLVKRGLEGVADNTRDAFGNVNNDGRTILNMARPMVQRMREVNPHYGQALDAYGGEISGRDALLAGREALKDGAEDIGNVTQGYTPWESQNFALGNRSAMANDMATFGRLHPYGNAAARLRQNYGLPGTDTYATMQGLHGAKAVDRLAQAGEAEHQANQTYQAVRGNSSSMDRAAEMADQENAIQGAATGALKAIAGHPISGTGDVLRALGGGNTYRDQNRVQNELASILGGLDADATTGHMRRIGRERARQALVDQGKGVLMSKAARTVGALYSAAVAQPFNDPDDSE